MSVDLARFGALFIGATPDSESSGQTFDERDEAQVAAKKQRRDDRRRAKEAEVLSPLRAEAAGPALAPVARASTAAERTPPPAPPQRPAATPAREEAAVEDEGSPSPEAEEEEEGPPPALPAQMPTGENFVAFVAFKMAQPRTGCRSIYNAFHSRVFGEKQTKACYKYKNKAKPLEEYLYQDVFVQQKFDGHRQLVSCVCRTPPARSSITVHNKNDANSNFDNVEALDEIRRSLEPLVEDSLRRGQPGFVLDTELVALDRNGKEDLYSCGLVKKKDMKGERRPQFEFVIFDISRPDLDEQTYRTRYEYLQSLRIPHSHRHVAPGDPPAGAASPASPPAVCLVRNLAVWNVGTTPETCAQLGGFVVDHGMEGIVFRGCNQPFAARRPGSDRRAPNHVGLKLKPEHLAPFIAKVLAVGVSRTFQLIVVTGEFQQPPTPYPAPPRAYTGILTPTAIAGPRTNLVGKARTVEKTRCIQAMWLGDRRRIANNKELNQPLRWKELGERQNQYAQVWFGIPFVVMVKCDYRLSSLGLLQYAVAVDSPPDSVGETSPVPTLDMFDSTFRIQARMTERARTAFTDVSAVPEKIQGLPAGAKVVDHAHHQPLREQYDSRLAPYPRLDGTYDEWKALKGAALTTAFDERNRRVSSYNGIKVSASAKVELKRQAYINSRMQPWDENILYRYSRLAFKLSDGAYDALLQYFANAKSRGDVDNIIELHGGVMWKGDAQPDSRRKPLRHLLLVTDDSPEKTDATRVVANLSWFEQWLQTETPPPAQ